MVSKTVPVLYGFDGRENLMVVIWSFISSLVRILQMGAELFKNLSTILTRLVLQVMVVRVDVFSSGGYKIR